MMRSTHHHPENATNGPGGLNWPPLREVPFATVSHDLHRQRRGVMNPYFSKQRIVALEPLVRSKITKLAQRFSLAAQDASTIHLDVAFMALTTNVFSDYASVTATITSTSRNSNSFGWRPSTGAPKARANPGRCPDCSP